MADGPNVPLWAVLSWRKVEPVSKAAANRDHTSAPVPSSPEQIRNVVLVGPGGAGKSTLFDYLIAARTPGRRPHEGEHERSVGVQVAAVESAGLTVNLIDTPGYPDFVGELRAGLRAADAAIFVISGAAVSYTHLTLPTNREV